MIYRISFTSRINATCWQKLNVRLAMGQLKLWTQLGWQEGISMGLLSMTILGKCGFVSTAIEKMK